jgi:aspartate carbamoyltransferase
MGGTYIDLPDNSSLKKGESEEDTVRTLSQYADCIIIRHPKDVRNLAHYSNVPVINAGDGSNEHPTQALLDMFTIIENVQWPNLKIMFTGDLYHSRTINSLVRALDKYITHANCAPGNVEFIFTNDINSELKRYPHTMIDEKDIPYCIDTVDVLYMTRPQIERHNPLDKATHSDFVLTNELANKMKKDAVIMHPLPRTKELLPEVDSNPRAKYFDQVKNGVYIRMALLYWLL